jgi:transcriptional regulator with XRE-family HTH domain
MITNERQYRITKARLQDFESALAEIQSLPRDERVSAELLNLQREALASQHDELTAQVDEYERLRAGENPVLETTLIDLPKALIAARIAQGLTQKDLAQQLGIKEQQIQRWESTSYANTTFGRLREIVNALGVQVREEVFLPTRNFHLKALIKNLKKIGLTSEQLLQRLLPAEAISRIAEATAETPALVFQCANLVARVFGLSPATILAGGHPQLNLQALAAGRFKIPANAGEDAVSAYTLYAHYLATVVERCTRHLTPKPLPKSWQEVNAAIPKGPNGAITFENALDYIWSLGIAVLPLQDPGAFHGAVWMINGRPIIVLKQRARLSSRWLFDLIHELDHILQNSTSEHHPAEFYVVELHPISPERRESPEEIAASEFAEDVLFNGRSADAEKACVTAARGNIRNLKNIVPKVAADFSVEVGVLANHMAFRLAQQDENWWPTAITLQRSSTDPFVSARDRLLTEIRLKELSEMDRDLLIRACSDLTEKEDVNNG